MLNLKKMRLKKIELHLFINPILDQIMQLIDHIDVIGKLAHLLR